MNINWDKIAGTLLITLSLVCFVVIMSYLIWLTKATL